MNIKKKNKKNKIIIIQKTTKQIKVQIFTIFNPLIKQTLQKRKIKLITINKIIILIIVILNKWKKMNITKINLKHLKQFMNLALIQITLD